jgi:coenzyme F420-reducing hydrogenase delta subunit
MFFLWHSPNQRNAFSEISDDISQNSGEAYVMKATFLGGNENRIIEEFRRASDGEYKELLEKCEDFFGEIRKETERKNYTFIELEENEYEYNKMTEWYRKISERDFFSAPMKEVSISELEKCKKLLDEFSDKIYRINTNESGEVD